MKYVRIKDGIYEIEDLGCDPAYYGEFTIADTIEELCDVYVQIEPGDFGCGIWHSVIYHMNLIVNKKELYDESYEVYGAIWTDKGLIYVAKMNDKGELELL